eukprot:CAMPEP_0117481974 /NCGR_PEP_ID=MMETSP0784-20121206/13177_1 /TAXON_ID=39447 /ORGANISM="" /LENGTH=343 /DNA_ID=CAMNT_0005276449 /DNA_START=1 /DNA_END=1032 /DNA_ORIENTATION=-
MFTELQTVSDIRIVDLRVYPVKSCGGISLSSARTAPTGLEWDRVLAVVDQNGYAQTQRKHRMMAAIRPSLDVEAKTITLETDGMEPLQVSLRDTEANGCTRMRASLGHGDPVPAWRYPKAATDWLTRCLAGTPGLTIDGDERRYRRDDQLYHLVRYDDTAGYQRLVMHDVGGDNALPEDQVAFPDLFPLLLTTRESLDEVNRRVPTMDVTMDRFRPNIVVAGSPEPFDEDNWAIVELGDGSRAMTLRCLEQDPRCQIPSIDQRTGEKNARFEPSRTLRSFRRLPFDLFGKAGDLAGEGPMFGIYAAHGGKPGELRLGDSLRILERSAAGSLHEHWTTRRTKSA